MSKPRDRSEGIVVHIPHNLETWFVKTIGRQTARGNEFGFISGADGKVMWNDDGTIFNKEWAENVVDEHNNWLMDQKPLALKILEARREVKKRKDIMEEAETVFYGAIEIHKKSVILLSDCEYELNKQGDKDGKESN